MASRKPRYQLIAEELRRELHNGVYAVGAVFPREVDLCERFCASRFTVRSALKDLENAGLVERHKARGTIVLNTDPQSTYVQSIGSLDELTQYPAETTLRLVSVNEVRATNELAASFECAKDTPLVKVGAVRLSKDKKTKICWVDVYVLPAYAGFADHIGTSSEPVFQIIADAFNLSVADINITLNATTLTAPLAHALEVEVGSPAVEILRTYREASGRVFEVSVSRHPQGRFSYSMSFKRQEAGRRLTRAT